jgi:hypothetical protein
MTQRQLLLAAGVLAAIERLHGLILAQATETRMLLSTSAIDFWHCRAAIRMRRA